MLVAGHRRGPATPAPTRRCSPSCSPTRRPSCVAPAAAERGGRRPRCCARRSASDRRPRRSSPRATRATARQPVPAARAAPTLCAPTALEPDGASRPAQSRALGPRTVARSILLRLGRLPGAGARAGPRVAVLGAGGARCATRPQLGRRSTPRRPRAAADALRRRRASSTPTPDARRSSTRSCAAPIYARHPAGRARRPMHARPRAALARRGRAPRGRIAPHLLPAPTGGARPRSSSSLAPRGAPALARGDARRRRAATCARALDEPPRAERARRAARRARRRASCVPATRAAADARARPRAVRARPRTRAAAARREVRAGPRAQRLRGPAPRRSRRSRRDRSRRRRRPRARADGSRPSWPPVAIARREHASARARRRLERHARPRRARRRPSASCSRDLARQAHCSGGPRADASPTLATRALAGGGSLREDERRVDRRCTTRSSSLMLCDRRRRRRTRRLDAALADARDARLGHRRRRRRADLSALHRAARRGDIAAAEADARSDARRRRRPARVPHAMPPWRVDSSTRCSSAASSTRPRRVLGEYGVARARSPTPLGRVAAAARARRAAAARRAGPTTRSPTSSEVARARGALAASATSTVAWRVAAALSLPAPRRRAPRRSALARPSSSRPPAPGARRRRSARALRVARASSPAGDAGCGALERGGRRSSTLARRRLRARASAPRARRRAAPRRPPRRRARAAAPGASRSPAAAAPPSSRAARTRSSSTAGARPRRLQFSGADALTASERRVADLAATGQSNREIAQALFVTVKTVENHLGRTYTRSSASGPARSFPPRSASRPPPRNRAKDRGRTPMTRWLAARSMRLMSTPRHLHLEILSPEDPVTGTLKDELGQEIPFSGWMSLPSPSSRSSTRTSTTRRPRERAPRYRVNCRPAVERRRRSPSRTEQLHDQRTSTSTRRRRRATTRQSPCRAAGTRRRRDTAAHSTGAGFSSGTGPPGSRQPCPPHTPGTGSRRRAVAAVRALVHRPQSNGPERRKPRTEAGLRPEVKPAASYSPGPLRAKYHRR